MAAHLSAEQVQLVLASRLARLEPVDAIVSTEHPLAGGTGCPPMIRPNSSFLSS
jgi:hypothetical protein